MSHKVTNRFAFKRSDQFLSIALFIGIPALFTTSVVYIRSVLPPVDGGTQGADRKSAEGEEKEEYFVASEREMVAPGRETIAPGRETIAPGRETSPGSRRSPAKEWTDADIDRMQPPRDGLKRNPEGLILNLRQFGITPAEQRAVILKCNFGIIGHPVWRGFSVLRDNQGKIRLPGRYLLSLCQ